MFQSNSMQENQNILTWQYFLIWAKSFSISFLPTSSFHLRQALVKAFFLDLLLFIQEVKIKTRYQELELHRDRIVGKRR